jgi:hypothetical protein
MADKGMEEQKNKCEGYDIVTDLLKVLMGGSPVATF